MFLFLKLQPLNITQLLFLNMFPHSVDIQLSVRPQYSLPRGFNSFFLSDDKLNDFISFCTDTDLIDVNINNTVTFPSL